MLFIRNIFLYSFTSRNRSETKKDYMEYLGSLMIDAEEEAMLMWTDTKD
jgi:hypothetical protein